MLDTTNELIAEFTRAVYHFATSLDIQVVTFKILQKVKVVQTLLKFLLMFRHIRLPNQKDSRSFYFS